METLDQALRNIPYLLSLNKKPRVPFPINFTTNQNNSVPFQKTLMNLQRITSNESSILEKSNLHVSKHLNEPGNKSSILRSPPHSKQYESLDGINSNTARKMNILDEINKECNDSFNEEIAQSKEDLPELFKQHEFHNKEELEFIFEEQIFEKEYKNLIPHLDEDQIKQVEKFREFSDKESKYNQGLYEFNEALFNKNEARLERQKTHNMMMKAIEYEINKMEKNSKKIENEIKDGGERVKEIDKNMDVINNDLKKLIYERETEALMKRIDYTLENPLKTSEVFGNKSEASFEQNKKKFDSKLATIFQNNEEAFQEIDKCMQKFGLNLPPNDYSFSLNQQSSENSNQIVQITEEMSNSITESITNKMLQKAKTLERELRGQKNKKLVCALENAPTQRNNKNNKSTENKKINVTKEAPKNTSKNLNKKPKQEIKKRPINSHY